MMTAKLGLLALVMVAATGQDLETRYDRFRLFNNCEPMRLSVADLTGDPDAADIELTTERLVVAAESRLRGARLYTEDLDQPHPVLELMVNIARAAFSTSFALSKTRARSRYQRGYPGDHVGGRSNWTTQWECRIHRFLCVETPRPVPDGIPAGERSRLQREMTFSAAGRGPLW